MTGMDDLVTWLRAQLDEDERLARAAVAELGWHRETGTGNWRAEGGNVYDVAADSDGRHVVADEGVPTYAQAEHIAHWDPARVLAEVDAKRRILDRYEDAVARQSCPEESAVWANTQVGEYQDWILPALALPYAGREGWREGWRP